MRRNLTRVLTLIFAMGMVLSFTGTYAMALDTPETEEEISESSSTAGVTNNYCRIYTGNGADRWLHISPWYTPNVMTIKMIDYNGVTVWEETFTALGVTHWFVGSNVQYVELKGIPGGPVDVSDTEH